ncbi:molybdopterin molybdotransferase MoeA [Desulfovibrio sp. OttesenSCG-928-M16]|nr:molybdopterin molybdotransferase MoeA [Desulfovibrio sp. OttesenSCG-928-M16]
MNTFLTLQSVDQVLERITELPPLEAERIPVLGALGRALAGEFLAPEDLPGFDRSTVDGFAVRARDVFGASEAAPALLDLIGECQMGTAPDLIVGPGQSARIWTGGMLPEGADAVVMLEYSRAAGTARIELIRPVAPQDNVILRDEDVTTGRPLFPAGWVLRPQDLGLLASLGQESVQVRRKPKIAVISSGDEVAPVSTPLRPGIVRECNSFMLCALVESAGGEAVSLGLVPDDLNVLTAALEKGLSFADAVLVSGGSSAGQRDFTRPAFERLPGCEVVVHGIAMRPGKPTIMARYNEKTLWGLPGNPTAAFITAEVFIRALVRTLLGQERPNSDSAGFKARLSRRVASAQGRRDYIRIGLEAGPSPEDFPVAVPFLGPSGLVSNPVRADGLVVCHESLEGLEAGRLVDVHLLRPLS